MRIWDTATGNQLFVKRMYQRYVPGVDISRDGTHAVAVSEGGRARIYDTATGALLWNLYGHGPEMILSAKFSPKGRFLLTGSSDKTAKLWKVETGECLATYPGHHWDWGAPDSLAFSPDGKRALIGCGDGYAREWDLTGAIGGSSLRR